MLSILLAALLLLPVMAPLLAAGQDAEAGVPLCCRRNGRHHCRMGMAAMGQAVASDAGAQWTAPAERCPYCPANVTGAHAHGAAAALTTARTRVALASGSAGTVEAASLRRGAWERGSRTRGPPNTLS